MERWIHFLPYFIIAFPLFATVIIYQVRFMFGQNNWKAVHAATQWSSVFYILAVVFLLRQLFGSYYIGSLLIMLICLLAIILIIQWKVQTEVLLLKGMKVLLRISFLLFGIAYFGLLAYWAVDYFYLSS